MIRIKQKLVHILLPALLLALFAMPGMSVGAARLTNNNPQYTVALQTGIGDIPVILCNGGSSSGGNCGGG
ncbi:MAG: hypothetical protein HND43_11070 [Armatimonadetes bacterium]|nr:hypothetical protein [Ardenticatenaceae bacterium]NOG39911.1 hypothetical protein [Armatimonadota bacterium]GIK57940.1 MAG: hypothetical protein BroJett015_36030 [Chloroflexota bacterium]